ncbi:MAG: RNA polymerase sigma factor [Alcaligenaceae bacterium]|nr:MAG: RNA polymerase sigma factor [Alcaligenaceae bacterium]
MPPQTQAILIDRIVELRPVLRRRAAALIGGRHQIGTPDDYVQDTIVTALQSLHRFEDDNLTGWLVTILHGHIRNASRRAYVRTSVPLAPPSDGFDDKTNAMAFSVAATQEYRLNVADVIDALEKLSSADRDLIMLARIDGKSPAEIAEHLKVPLGTMHARLSRATARLRDLYDAEPRPDVVCGRFRHRRAA